jgi:putative copper resistance protein D
MEMGGSPVWLVLLRGAQDACLLFLLGTLGFAAFIVPRHLVGWLSPSLHRLVWISGAVALVLSILWFFAEAAFVVGAHGITATLGALPTFLIYTQFAKILALRILLIVAASGLVGRPRVALAPMCIAVALQPWLGHAAQVGIGLASSEVLHLLSAGIWLGSLMPLLLCLRMFSACDAAQVLRLFTWIGLSAVSILAGTGLAQGFVLADGFGGLIHTMYGRVALLKAELFGLVLLLAACNGLVLTPRLGRSVATLRILQVSIGAEVLVGLVIVLAAGWLANLAPG